MSEEILSNPPCLISSMSPPAADDNEISVELLSREEKHQYLTPNQFHHFHKNVLGRDYDSNSDSPYLRGAHVARHGSVSMNLWEPSNRLREHGTIDAHISVQLTK